ncbi:MAG: GspE/PulE family protein, partial [Phycisphaerae bacterium]
QSGHITAARGGGMKELDKMVKIEVRTSGSTAGERLMMRVLAEETRFKISDLGMSDQQLRQFQAVVDRPRGLVLCCGPRQSGLTSTLYAILRSHDAFMKNIHTLELRPSLELENITQNIHDPHDSEVSFARRVQTILRADPDVVMIAAVADAETARLINQAAMERAKLYVGLNTSDCFEALQSWLSLVDDPRLVARALLAITAQRLVRRLCPECKQPYRPDPQTLRKANLPADRIQQFYRRGGYVLNKKGERLVCQTCQGSGYFGRTAIFELLVVDETVRKLIVSRASISQIKAACRKTRPPMLYLQEQGLRRVMEGVTSINEIIRVTRSEPSRAPTGAG